jgi:hypothetical protein
MKHGYEEHRHEGADWWHRTTRIHGVTQKRRDGEYFILTECGIGCGYWESEPVTTGYRNACDVCMAETGRCHVVDKVEELGGIVLNR